MKNFNFVNKSGMAVVIKTKELEKTRFGIYLTCEQMGIKDGWATFNEKDGQRWLTVHASETPDKRPYNFAMPKDIEDDILAEKLAACTMTDRIVVAKAYRSDGSIMFEKYCSAIAEPMFPNSWPWYTITERLDGFIRAQADGGHVYDMGGIEEEPGRMRKLYAGTHGPDRYQFLHKADKTWEQLFGAAFAEKDEVCTLTLEVVRLMDRKDFCD